MINSKKRGFTIIEVSLVLAIAGLIFLMIFVALPALQRSARDTKRREDMMELASQLKKFQTNNRGALPTGTGIINYSASASNKASWAGFYKNYLGADFKDPSSDGNYILVVEACGGGSQGNPCKTQYSDKNFTNDSKIAVLTSATCDGETARQSSNPRKIAIVYRLELGTYCGDL